MESATWASDGARMAAVGGACLVAGAAAGYFLARRGAAPNWYRQQKTSGMPEELFRYVLKVGARPTAEHAAIAAYTEKLGTISRMCVSADEGQFLETMGRIVEARNVIEVGCFTGYGTLSLARGCTGRVFTLDISDKHLPQAREQWKAAGVADRVEHIKGRASASMRLLRSLGAEDGAADAVRKALKAGDDSVTGAAGEGAFDLVFVDADKAGYADYVEQAHSLLRKGGVVLVDNVLWSGRVIAPEVSDKDTVTIRELNEALRRDERWDMSMIPLADGVTILRKR